MPTTLEDIKTKKHNRAGTGVLETKYELAEEKDVF